MPHRIRKRQAVLVAVGLAVLAACLFPAAIVGGKVLSANDLLFFQTPFSAHKPAELEAPSNPWLFDAVYVFHPEMQLVRDMVRSADPPLWNPFIQAGRPLLASQQSAPLYPLTWLTFVGPFWESLAWIALLKLVLAGLGTFLFARRLGLGGWPASLAAVSYPFSTYFVMWLQHPHTNAYLLLPWLLLAVERTVATGSRRWAAGLAAGMGLSLLSGHPQSAALVLVLVAAYAVLRLVWRAPDDDDQPRIRIAGKLIGASVVATLIGAVSTLPFLELVGESVAADRDLGTLPSKSLYGYVLPHFWGRADRALIPGAPPFVEGTGYFGGVALLLGLAGLVLRRSAVQLFFAGAVVVGLAVAFDTGPFSDAARAIPVLGSASLVRVLALVAFSGAMLGAFGLQHLISAKAPGRIALLVALGTVLPLTWLAEHSGALRQWASAFEHLPSPDRFGVTPLDPAVGDAVRVASLLRWALIGASVVLCTMLLRRRRRAALAVPAVLVALAAVDLVTAIAGYHPAIPRERAEPPEPATIGALRGLQGQQRVIAEGGALGPNLADRYKLKDIRGHDLPAMKRYIRLYAGLGGQALGASVQRTEFDVTLAGSTKLLDVFGVRYALAPGLAYQRGLPVVTEDGGVPAIVHNPAALPRAWVAYGWRPSRDLDDSLRQTQLVEAAELLDAPVVEGAGPPPVDGSLAADPAEVSLDGTHRVVVEATADRAGWLVLNDTYFPGWRATVDGERAEILPANTAFRAVRVPPGRHVVEFSYRPASVIAGAALSAVGALLVLVALVGRPRRRRRAGRPAVL